MASTPLSYKCNMQIWGNCCSLITRKKEVGYGLHKYGYNNPTVEEATAPTSGEV